MSSIPGGNDPFSGGYLNRQSNPVAVGGSFGTPGHEGRSGPVSGVGATNPLFAKNNTGSNIRIPYARIAPISDKSAGVPNTNPENITFDQQRGVWIDQAADTGIGPVTPVKMLHETDNLRSMRVAFILGKKGGQLKLGDGVKRRNALDPFVGQYGPSYARGENVISLGVGGRGVDRIQKMASIEYVSKYMDIVLSGASISIQETGPDIFEAELPTTSSDIMKAVKDNAKSLCQMTDIAFAMATTNNNRGDLTDIPNQGIFFMDESPFFRGKALVDAMVSVRSDSVINTPIRVSRALGDSLAFDCLDMKIMKAGLMDWAPDGIVISKLSNGPTEEDDARYDAKDGQLFNIAIQGPQLATNWTGDYKLLTLPTDKVFILIECDVLFGKTSTRDTGIPEINDKLDGLSDSKYRKIRDTMLNEDAFENGTVKAAFLAKQVAHWNAQGDDRDVLLLNFRLRVSTSSEMINTSSPHGSAKTKRMGLRLGMEMGEYIIGGWSIGSVMDTAASRGSIPGMPGITGSAEKGGTSMALNVNVGIQWYNSYELWKKYNNTEGSLKMRHEYDQHNVPVLPFNVPVNKAEAAKDAHIRDLEKKKEAKIFEIQVRSATLSGLNALPKGRSNGTNEEKREYNVYQAATKAGATRDAMPSDTNEEAAKRQAAEDAVQQLTEALNELDKMIGSYNALNV